MVPTVRDSTTLQSPKASSAEDALKRNTDCVYFLASPLTCKKGSQCEYRHSETARLNPRDCWYWLNSNCLNPKCAFRHPPLDGLLGTQAPTSSGPSVSTSRTSTTKAICNPGKQINPTNAIYNQGKQTVLCVFFQKGFCSKGDRCAFSHGINPVSNTIIQAPVTFCEHSNVKKVSSILQKCSQPQANVPNLTKVPLQVKPVSNSESSISRSGIVTEKSYPEPMGSNEVGSISVEKIVPPVTRWSNHMLQTDLSDDYQDEEDGDELYRESSPGFDVLVDDELRDSGYYPGGDQFGRPNLNKFDDGGSADYNQVKDVSREKMFSDHQHGYDSYDHMMQARYDSKLSRVSRERNSGRSDSRERMGYDYLRSDNINRMENSDLRHRLKLREVNGLRSTIIHDHAHDRSLSSRLVGRINILERSKPSNNTHMHSERDSNRGRNTVKGRVQEDFNYEERNFRGSRTRRYNMRNDGRTDFTGPKSLAEPKVSKSSSGDRKEQGQYLFSDRKRANRPLNGDVSFEGPMPFSEILKRKRGAESNNNLLDLQESSSKYTKVDPFGRVDGHQSSSKEPYVTEVKAENGTIHDLDYEQTGHHYSSKVPCVTEIEAENGTINDFDYEQTDEVDYNLDDEGEDVDQDDEYLDDEETEVDFARKISLMLS